MKLTQRFATGLVSFAVLAFTAAEQKQNTPKQDLAFVGTYTSKTDSRGIYALGFDPATGKLTAKGLAAETPDPSWVVIHPTGKWAYAANEAGKNSAITAFSIDARSAKLTQLNQLPALGEDPCYLSFDKTGKYLFVANYTSGNVVAFPILPDGKLGRATANVKDSGALGPNKERQEAPHAHWIQASPDNRFVLVSDLGLDVILSYRFDLAKGTLTPNDAPFAKLAAGAGPRHATFSPDGTFLYVVSELNSTVTVFAYDPIKGTSSASQVVSTLPAGFQGRNDTAEILLHPGGKWLFASNRGHDSIAVFSIDAAKGTLANVGVFSTGGKEPRHFTLDPTGHFVLAENQNSNTIVVFRFDPASGSLTPIGDTASVPSPVSLTFLP